ncbi:MAG: GSCFA domain-containing protein [Rikenellaceae bacterium]
MIKFRTEIEIDPFPFQIEYSNSLFFIGSCFATAVGERCAESGLHTMVNPFGVTYNPLSVLEVLRHITQSMPVDRSRLRKVGDKWCSMLHHSSFNSATLPELEKKTMDATRRAHDFIRQASVLVITLGTAWVYQEMENVTIVNNCHKIPDKEFIRRRLTVSEIVDNFSDFVDNSDKKIIFTISPIRHLKDTMAGNSLSKAVLRTAVGELCEKYPEQVFYFPSFEIMMDDLRDYRFYDVDMLHPNSVAVEYIYALFEKMLLSSNSIDYCRRMVKITSAMAHRVTDQESEEYRRFKKKMLANLLQIKADYPLGDYRERIDFFK